MILRRLGVSAALALTALTSATSSLAANNRSFTVTSFNIRFYGTGGSPSGSSESRDQSIREFIAEQGVDSDVLVFQEIVDVPRLVSRVLKNRYNCYSYEHSDSGHQHVVMCVKPPFSIVRADDDDDLVLQEVNDDYPRLRPGMHGLVVSPTGRRIAHVIGVHLKAGADSADIRFNQVRAIGRYLRDRVDILPVVITGDFNTHGDDAKTFSDILEASEPTLAELPNSSRYTFRVPDAGYKFDHVWASSKTSSGDLPRVSVKGPCNVSQSQVDVIKAYYDAVSDHCPIKVTVPY